METKTNIPSWAQGVIAVAAVGATIYIGWLVQKGLKNKKLAAGAKAETKATENELNGLIVKGQGPSLSKAQLQAMANQIFTAMDGYGTDNKAVLSVFTKVKNKADILGLIDAYGIREISSGKLNPEPNFKGTLPAAMTSEIPATSSALLNYGLLVVNPVAGLAAISNGDVSLEGINKVLKAKKIDFQF